jgi:TPR repeat protein
MYENGQGVTQDYARAAQLYDQACQGGYMRGCSNLGVMHRDGQGVTQDYARAAQLYEQACQGGYMGGCLNLGAAYYNGEGVSRDVDRALTLMRRACEGGNAQACGNVRTIEQQQAQASAGPQFRTTIGSSTIGSGGGRVMFENVRATCGMFQIMGAMGSLRPAIRSCLRRQASPRVTLTFENGRVTEASSDPDNRSGQCLVRAARRARVGTLSCVMELSARRP